MPLTIFDPSPSVLASGLKRFDTMFARDVEKKRISAQDAEEARARIKGVEGDGSGSAGNKFMDDDTELVIEVGSGTAHLRP